MNHENTPVLWLAPVSSSNFMLMSRKKLQHTTVIRVRKISIISIHGSAMTPNTADNFVYALGQVGILIRKSANQGGAEHLAT